MNPNPHIIVLSTPPDYWIDADESNYMFEVSLAENRAASICQSPNMLMNYFDSEDCADLFDGTVRLKLHSQSLPLADAAIVAAFLPADERDAIHADIRAAVQAWLTQRELGE